MTRLRERTFEIGGFRTRSLELDGSGKPLLLLHGWADSADTWRQLLDVLARQGRRAIALDMPGFGRAARLEADRAVLPQLDRFAAAAARLEAESSGEEVVIVGNSLGGCVAMRIAERAELPLAGIVPVAPAGLDMAQWFSIIEGERLIRLLMSSPLPIPEILVRDFVGRTYRNVAFADPRAVDGMAISSFTRHLATREDVTRVLATGRRLRGELDGCFRLERIDCPVLLVWGEHDRMVFPTGAQRVIDAVDGARIVRIPDCGHCPQIECPERLWKLLAEFPARALAAAA